MTRPLRIGIVSQSYYPVLGGVTEHVHGLAKALLDRGHSVTIVTGKRAVLAKSVESRTADEAERELRSLGGEILRVGRTYRLRWNGAMVSLVGGLSLPSDLRAISRDRFDVLHLHAPFEPILPLLAACHFRAPRVATFHSAGRSDAWYRVLYPAYASLSKSLAVRVAVSQAAHDFVARVFRGTYHIIPNGVDVARFRIPRDSAARLSRQGLRQSMEARSARRRLLYVGRLDPRKGLETLFAALEHLDPDVWELDVVGSGPLASRLAARARDARLSVQFHGSVSAEDLARFYRTADLAVAPAEYGESFGVCLLEAMASGVPIVASDLPGYREVLKGRVGEDSVGETVSAVLVPPGDVGSWARALRVLLSDPPLLRRLSLSGTHRVSRFDWATVAGEVERCYDAAVSGESIPASPQPRAASRLAYPILDDADDLVALP